MREILFKAKRVDNGTWVEGLLWKKKYNDGNRIFISCFPDKDDNEEVYVVCPETVSQFTGLYDKHGNRIFEGDICQIKGISYIDETPFVVEWNDEYSGWFWRELSFSSPTDTITPEIAKTAKVIGNIHDNGELLTAERIGEKERI